MRYEYNKNVKLILGYQQQNIFIGGLLVVPERGGPGNNSRPRDTHHVVNMVTYVFLLTVQYSKITWLFSSPSQMIWLE